VTVFDACALIAFLLDEPAAPIVEQRLREEGEEACISCVNAAEIVDRLIRIGGQSEERVMDSLDWLVAGGMLIMPADQDMGRLAGQLRARHYRRGDAALSLADCMALSTAISLGRPLATADPALARLARNQGVEVVALPDSRGAVP
jgi:PIN domain nuclease of toxin-antitoxin system